MSHTRALQDGFPKVSLMNITPLPLLIMTPHNDLDLDSIGTPENCVADFCLIPVYFLPAAATCFQVLIGQQIGTATASVSQEVAEVQRLMQRSSLSYSMHSAGTTVGE